MTLTSAAYRRRNGSAPVAHAPLRECGRVAVGALQTTPRNTAEPFSGRHRGPEVEPVQFARREQSASVGVETLSAGQLPMS